MALQALKETKNSAARCRLSPPSSPSKRAASSSATANKPQAFQSRILAALDAEMENILPKANAPVHARDLSTLLAQTKSLQASAAVVAPTKPNTTRSLTNTIHPFFQASKRKANVNLASKLATHKAPVMPISNADYVEPPPKTRKKDNMLPHPILIDELARLAAESVTANLPTMSIQSLPLSPTAYSYSNYSPKPALVYTRHEEEANDLVACLKGPLGFDMEWLVFFNRGSAPTARRTALVQLCDKRMILLIQVSAMQRFPQKVKELIENHSVVKVGANILNDGRKLFNDFGIEAAGLVELGALAHEADPEFKDKIRSKRRIVNLAEMVRLYCDGKILDKGDVRTGNWEAQPLNNEQKTYAANDAYSGLMAALKLFELAEQGQRTLDAERFTSRVTTAMMAPSILSRSASSSSSASTDASTTPNKNAVASISNTASSTISSHLPAAATAEMANPSPSRQHMRAYTLWHQQKMLLDDICATLRTIEKPLAASTVISYVVTALKNDPSLPYSMTDLKALVHMEIGSWMRHRDWILRQGPEGRS